MNDFRPDFLITPYALIADDRVTPADERVYSVCYWFQKLKDGQCTASNATIAKIANLKVGTVKNSISKLAKLGYLEVLISDRRKNSRSEIRCNVQFTRTPSSHSDAPSLHNDGPRHHTVNRVYNTNKEYLLRGSLKKVKNTKPLLEPISQEEYNRLAEQEGIVKINHGPVKV